MARGKPEISSRVTNDPGRRDRRASRKLFDTLLSCPVFTYTTRLCLSLPLYFITVSPFPSSRPRTRESLEHTQRRLSRQTRSLLWKQRGEREELDANFLFEFFSPLLLEVERGRFDRTQETVNRSSAVRVPLISRLRDTGTDGSHCILIRRSFSLPRLEELEKIL